MIKQTMVVSCDICASVQEVKKDALGEYDIPGAWITSPNNPNVHLCPRCARPLLVDTKGKPYYPPGTRLVREIDEQIVEVEGEKGQVICFVQEEG